jgi:hypothetical protein
MKAVPAASLLLLLLSVSVFGHGVERGSIWNSIANSDLGLLSDLTRQEISNAVETRCNLTGMVSASAEFASSDDSVTAVDPNSIRIRILVKIESKNSPETIIVVATQKSFPVAGEPSAMDYVVSSPICH